MLQLENQVKGEIFRVPQHLSEINFKYVADKVKDIHVNKFYGIVAILQTAKLRKLLNPDLKGVGQVKFILVKANYPENEPEVTPLNRFLYIAPSDVFTGIDCNPRSNELAGYVLKQFVEDDKDLRMSVMSGNVFRNVSSGAVRSLIADDKSASPKQLITTITETVVSVGYKIVQLSSIQGHNKVEGLPAEGEIQKFIVATNLLKI